MKKFFLVLIISFIISINILPMFSIAQQWHWGRRWDTPIEVFENTTNELNKEDWDIQNTALNSVSETDWSYPAVYKISNTLESIRKKIYPYLDRIVYLWTTIAVMLIIYNWISLIIEGFKWEANFWKLKNIKNIALWLAVLRWFWAIIKLWVIIINLLAGN